MFAMVTSCTLFELKIIFYWTYVERKVLIAERSSTYDVSSTKGIVHMGLEPPPRPPPGRDTVKGRFK